MVKVLVTGGSGYVGSHCVCELLNHNYEVVVMDNLTNSVQLDNAKLPQSLIQVEKITGKKILKFFAGNVEDKDLLVDIFTEYKINVVMHFAALKSVSESVSNPLKYYYNNVFGSMTLLSVMQDFQVKKFIFSSSATVYGDPIKLPIDESHPTGQTCSNPYGRSKYMVERIMEDMCVADKSWSVISLRYFNPVGAHESGLIGENPTGIPNNLMPYITQVSTKVRPVLKIFGKDYPTEDGTALRDYIHISDLAEGHIAALENMLANEQSWFGFYPINLGTGKGTSVFEMVKAFEKANNVKIPYEFVERRPGDVCTVYADAQLAKKLLNWQTKRTIEDMCSSAYNWQVKNPKGFAL